jgi:DNA-binding GntR family transcriptional regulator
MSTTNRAATMSETITDYIQHDLKARLRSGAGLPEKLTLAAIAQHYRVSLTPVRLAVGQLIAERVLRKQANGRMEVNLELLQQLPAVDPRSFPERPAGTTEIEAVLTGELIHLSLRGRAEPLREEATAERFGIGRTVLRQLLNRLAGKGLVEHLPRRGWRVRPFDEDEMCAYLQVRESLELKALELARPHLKNADLQRMLRGNRRGTTPRLDNALHRYLVDKAGNRYIQEFFDRHGIYYATLFDYAAPETNVVRAMAHQHCTILQALIDRDWQSARRALAHHIRSQRPIVRRLLADAQQVRKR